MKPLKLNVNGLPPIEILHVGYNPNLEGTSFYPITQEQLDQLAKDYNPKIHIAPVTLDHKQEGPAFGWIERLEVVGDKLFAHLKDVAEDLVNWVREGRYKTRSAEIHPRFYANSDKPYIWAVSFLGAAKPAIAGMEDCRWSADGKELLCFSVKTEKGKEQIYTGPVIKMEYGHEEPDFEHFNIATEMEKMEEENFLRKALQTFDNIAWACVNSALENRSSLLLDYISQLKEVIDKGEVALTSKEVKLGEKKPDETLTLESLQKQILEMGEKHVKALASEKEKNENLQKEIVTLKAENRKRTVTSLLDKLVLEGRVTPAQRDAGLDTFLMNLPDGTFTLKDKTYTFESYINEMLSALPPVVKLDGQFFQTPPLNSDDSPKDDVVKLKSIIGDKVDLTQVDPKAAKLTVKIDEIMLRDKCDWLTAAAKAEKENPDLAPKKPSVLYGGGRR